ncbi:MAG TPA: rod shape-determining protein MreC [Terriglobales bacterium]|nr:rod shape-determining protein MreC [Terriglobales bacterium]
METVLGRYRNLIILVGVLFLQVLGLAVQVKRNAENESSRLIRIWTVNAVTPFEKGLVWIQSSTSNVWHNYFYLRGVRAENRQLKAEIERLRLQQVRLTEDAEQARRLQALLAFKEQFISQTVPAQVIGSSGSELSRSVYIDKGTRDGIKPDMAVITADGIVGKVFRVFHSTSQVLLIDDQSSGVGALLEKSRLQGVLKGTPAGEIVLEKVAGDEQVQSGEAVVTSGGDRIFPKGLRVGTVTRVSQSPDLFLNIRVKPAANLSKLEEVLVVTKVEEKDIAPSLTGAERAADILAQRLPSVPDKAAGDDAGKTKGPGVKPPVAPVAPVVAPLNAQGAAEKPGKAAVAGASPLKTSAGSVANVKPAQGNSAAAAASPSGSPVSVKPATAQKPGTVVKVAEKNAKPAATAKPASEQNLTNQNQAAPTGTEQAKPEPTRPVEPLTPQPKPDQAKPDQPPPSQDTPQ